MPGAGQETTVRLPWREFVAVKRARVDRDAPKLDPARVRQLGLVLSRFEFNGLANPNYRAGPFSLKVLTCCLSAAPAAHKPAIFKDAACGCKTRAA